MTDGRIVFAGLMPHAPILVPGVGTEQHAEAVPTMDAMATVSIHAVANHPDTLVLISPHSPRQPGAFGIWRPTRLRGSLAKFGAPEAQVDVPIDQAFVERLEMEAAGCGIRTWRITDESLDHGATVPLFYLQSAGWKGPTVIVSLDHPGDGAPAKWGQAIAATAQRLSRRTAVIASGDMSHRLTRSAPCGYHPEAHRFDEAFISLLRNGAFHDVPAIDASLEELAAEDVAESTMVALAAADYRTEGHVVLSYQAPFGVGYGVAILFEPERTSQVTATPAEARHASVSRCSDLPAIARCAVVAEATDGPSTPPFGGTGELAERHGVFVTVRTDKGELRGCRGTLQPMEKDLVQETWRSAVAAAFHDHRFPPSQAVELPHMRFSVTVLGKLEPVKSLQELNPEVFGVLVSAGDGRKGVLLPDIGGIDSVEQQIAVARRKAGIGPDEKISIHRFTAISYEESRRPADQEPADG